ncbi:hypothetical protein [Schlesneria paludicola]|uniref:hypothetical protein n=1 Tax=Schlesneria paludicola TaxID=360056 RepID=UPI000311E79D|nr:hypothetical protein [Schlesneria paludicola]
MNEVVFDFAGMIRQIRTHQRRIVVPIVAMLVAVIVWMGLALIAVEQWGLNVEPPGEMTLKRAVVMLGWFGGTVIAIAICCWFVPRSPRFACPHCHEEFVERYDRMTVLSTGYCPKCLESLFAVDGTSGGREVSRSTELLTRIEFQERRSHLRPFNPLVPCLLGMSVIAVCFAVATKWDEPLDQSGERDWFPVYRFSVALAGGLATIGYIALRSRARLRVFNQCQCEECGEALGEDAMTSITGNCRNCGSQVLAERFLAPPWPHAKDVWTRSWYRVHGKRWQKWGWITCLTGAVPALAWMAVVYGLCPPSNPQQVNAAAALLMAFALVVQAISTFLGQRWLRHALGLKCPQCREELADVPQFVMPTRNCPFCQTTILAE